MTVPFSFVDLCAKELELCGLREGESVAVLSQMDERQDYADAFMAAARRFGAIPFQVRLPEASSTLTGDAGAWTVGVTPLGDNRPAIDALKQADLVIDLMFLLFSREQMEIQAAGARMLLCLEPIDNLARLFPTLDQRRRVEASEELLAAAKTFRFTNAAGTDVTYKPAGIQLLEQVEVKIIHYDEGARDSDRALRKVEFSRFLRVERDTLFSSNDPLWERVVGQD